MLIFLITGILIGVLINMNGKISLHFHHKIEIIMKYLIFTITTITQKKKKIKKVVLSPKRYSPWENIIECLFIPRSKHHS